jgi:hypothetical protein
VGGAAVQEAASEAALAATPGDGFYVNAGLNAVVVKVMDTRQQVSVEINF